MKKLFLSILSIVTICAIVFGTMHHMGSAIPFFKGIFTESKSEKDSKKINAFESIQADGAVMDITIERGDTYSIDIDATEGMMPEYSVQEGILNIRQANKQMVHLNDLDCDVIIRMPEGKDLKEININGAVGDIEISGISSKMTTISSDVGNINANDTDLGAMNLKTSVGDIEINDCAFTNADIYSDCGDVDIESANDLSDWKLNCETDIGKVTIQNDSKGQNFSQNGTGKIMTVECDTGDIDIDY